MQSIMQKNKEECYYCKKTKPAVSIHEHHVIYGTANRELSEKFGLKVYLCAEHHIGEHGVHFDDALALELKQEAQRLWEQRYGSRDQFREVFGKSFI